MKNLLFSVICWTAFIGIQSQCLVAQTLQYLFTHDASGNRILSAPNGASSPASPTPSSSQIVRAGDAASFNIMGQGTGPLSYQWRLNGTNISAATNATLFFASTVAANSGVYSVVVSNAGASTTNQAGSLTVLISTNALYFIAYGNSRYVAVGASGTVITSTDRYSWSASASGSSTNLSGVAYGSGIFVAVGAGGTVLSSPDGVNWSTRASGITNGLGAVTFGNGLFVAAGSAGRIISSPDGTNWTLRTTGTPALLAVAYANNLFVSVGTGGSIWTSTNGINWAARVSGTSATLNGIAFGSSNFIAVGSSGTILSSSTGTNWSARASGITNTFLTASFFSGTFFAVGPRGSNYVSSELMNWGKAASGTDEFLYGTVGASGVHLAVGNNGMIVEVPPPVLDHFEWSTIPSPQRASQSFAVTIAARDAANRAFTNFSGNVSLSATRLNSPVTNSILGNPTPTGTNFGNLSVGYSFTPNANLLVTHVRHYFGTKVSIWTDAGVLVASQSVSSTGTNWTESPLQMPIRLFTGVSYRVVALTGGANSYARFDGATTFSDGTINQSFHQSGDVFPTTTEKARWYFADLRYAVEQSSIATVTPAVSGNFVGGVWTGNITVPDAGLNVLIRATDAENHTGISSPIAVSVTNDLLLSLTDSPDPASVGSNLTYSISVNNPGPTSATSVYVTNTLPPVGMTFVSASASQGSCSTAGNIVSCNLGTITNLGSASVSISVTPTIAGIILTNSAKVVRGEADANSANNQAIVITQVTPTLSINDVAITEGNIGTTNAVFTVVLSSGSIQPVTVAFATANGTATAGSDYVATNGILTFLPGTTVQTVTVKVIGDVNISGNETFFVNLSNPVNASFSDGQGQASIANDDGLSGEVHHFDVSSVASPQRVNLPFAVTITAKDAFNIAVTNFSGSVKISGTGNGADETNNIIGSAAYGGTENVGTYTIGYAFVPGTNITVTHVRHYSGSKVSIWTDGGALLTSQAVDSVLGSWVETPLSAPVQLLAGSRYRVTFYSAGQNYFWVTNGAEIFPHGTIVQGYYVAGDSFPTNANSTKWFFVDLRYSIGTPVSLTPTVSGNFLNGVWSSNITVQSIAQNMAMAADDSNGHNGVGNVFTVLPADDIAVKLVAAPNPVTVGSNLTYTISVLNSGPSSATGVKLTNTLPVDASFVYVSTTQGSCTNSGGFVTCSLGTLTNLAAATVVVVVNPTIAGSSLTNSVKVARNEADADAGNNTASISTIASFSLSALVGAAIDASNFEWRIGGNGLWSNQTNVTHDGVDAALSGAIAHNQQSWMETAVNGPATLTFWWKVSSESGQDGLRFYTNGVQQTSYSGVSDWVQRSFTLVPGTNVLRWAYTKNASITAGSDAGWVDEITLAFPAINLESPAMLTNGLFQFSLVGTNGQKLIIEASTNLTVWIPLSTNTLTGSQMTISDGQSTNYPYRFYRAVFLPR